MKITYQLFVLGLIALSTQAAQAGLVRGACEGFGSEAAISSFNAGLILSSPVRQEIRGTKTFSANGVDCTIKILSGDSEANVTLDSGIEIKLARTMQSFDENLSVRRAGHSGTVYEFVRKGDKLSIFSADGIVVGGLLRAKLSCEKVGRDDMSAAEVVTALSSAFDVCAGIRTE